MATEVAYLSISSIYGLTLALREAPVLVECGADKRVIPGLRFLSYILKLDKVDEKNFLVLVVIRNRTQIDIVLLIWYRVP